jgi:hypothetical protein
VAHLEYELVWFQEDLPKASMEARRNTLRGSLRIEKSRAFFYSEGRVIPLEPIHSVVRGRRGSDFVNRWIEVQYGDTTDPVVAYLNDGGWRGWRPLLTASNRRMAAELSKLAV